ncbi:MAG: hypothetical protein ABIN18_28660 [Pseudomonadota bacterium]
MSIKRYRAPTNEQVNVPALERVALSLPVSENKGADEVSGADSEERTSPRWAFGSLSGS